MVEIMSIKKGKGWNNKIKHHNNMNNNSMEVGE